MPGPRRIGIQVPPTASEREAHEVARDVLEGGARKVGAEFREPDDDWRPMWIVLTRTQGTLVTGSGDKHQMTHYVAQLARRFGAHGVGHLHSSWMIEPEDVGGDQDAFDTLIELVRMRDGSTEGLPRREVVMVATYTAGEARQAFAPIHRSEGAPPTLGPFGETYTTTDHGTVEGAMVDPIVAALKRVG